MPIDTKMSALSRPMKEGTLAKWLVKEGDEVSSGDILAEIETDKATMEFEAVDEGKMAKILGAEGADGGRGGRQPGRARSREGPRRASRSKGRPHQGVAARQANCGRQGHRPRLRAGQ